jgi:2-haloacid dehalogenase
MINTIVFDLGGVLVDWNPEYVYRSLIPDPERRRYFFEHICTHDWNIEQDAGRDLNEATQLLVAQFPDWETEIRSYYGRWPEMLGEPIYGTLELLRKAIAHTDYRVYALTNWAAETWEIVLQIERFAFLHWFEGVVVSGQEKTRKPFADIYQILLSRYDITPNDAVFIDDNAANVAAARQQGMKGIHFQDPAQLSDELSALGISL